MVDTPSYLKDYSIQFRNTFDFCKIIITETKIDLNFNFVLITILYKII